ncbi:MAG TPA: DUF4013 domain-containing protein [Candidatus Dormibacteraeota bacterium]|jgi:hypothetical protein|nr:DUF4013 domain-containing protein [Candidatus Dormibacteraeota bacterium]
MGLIALIPIVGGINMLGWMLTTLDYYRQGRTDLPPAGFGYIGRGWHAFLALLFWSLPALLITLIAIVFLFVFIGVAAATSTGSSDSNQAAGGAAFLGILVFYALVFLVGIYGLVLYVLLPAILIATDRGGLSAGTSPSHVLGIARRNLGNTLLAALLIYVGNFLAGLGVYVCCVGIIFTIAYSYVVMAGVLRYYEYSLGDGAPPPAPPAAAPVTPA